MILKMACSVAPRAVMVMIMFFLVANIEIAVSKDLVRLETNGERIDRLLQEIEEYEESEIREDAVQDKAVMERKKLPKTIVSPIDRKLTFPDPPSTLNYVQLPEMSKDLQEFTICLYMRTDSERGSTLFSYYDKNGAEQISLYSDNRRTKYKFRINNKHHDQDKADLNNLDGKWHVICALWKGEDGSYQIWSDGKMRAKGEGLDKDFGIGGGGIFVLGQGGDKRDGFEEGAAFSGEISHFNVWDKWLSEAELISREKSCKFQGNIIDWNADDFKVTVQGKILIDKFSCVWKRELPAGDVDEVAQLAELAEEVKSLEGKE